MPNTPEGNDKPVSNERYTLTIDWPDFPDGQSPKSVKCDAQECRRLLHMLPSRFPSHTLYSAPLMIEIRET